MAIKQSDQLRYYYRVMATPDGRKRLAEYKRYRRRAIRAGLWKTKPESAP